MVGLSALIITRNEQEHIRACLDSVKWADEIVVVDSFSTDGTVEICKSYTEKVYQREWENYSSQKNFGHSKCHYDWVLSIDADERATSALQNEITEAIQFTEFVAYRIYIRDYMFGKWIQHGWEAVIHEEVAVEGAVGILSRPLLHYSHTSIAKFVKKTNLYSDLEAKRWYQQGIRKNWAIIILSSIRVFLIEYIQYQGFRDRGHGLVLAILLGIYHFLARAKLWELWYKHDHGISE
jgi:glycosyltransferase involved in cell wall biosynthesis